MTTKLKIEVFDGNTTFFDLTDYKITPGKDSFTLLLNTTEKLFEYVLSYDPYPPISHKAECELIYNICESVRKEIDQSFYNNQPLCLKEDPQRHFLDINKKCCDLIISKKEVYEYGND